MKHELREVWLSEACARRSGASAFCRSCPGEMETEQAVYYCSCLCHPKKKYDVKPDIWNRFVGRLRALFGCRRAARQNNA